MEPDPTALLGRKPAWLQRYEDRSQRKIDVRDEESNRLTLAATDWSTRTLVKPSAR